VVVVDDDALLGVVVDDALLDVLLEEPLVTTEDAPVDERLEDDVEEVAAEEVLTDDPVEEGLEEIDPVDDAIEDDVPVDDTLEDDSREASRAASRWVVASCPASRRMPESRRASPSFEPSR
jgi:hypothetical protein